MPVAGGPPIAIVCPSAGIVSKAVAQNAKVKTRMAVSSFGQAQHPPWPVQCLIKFARRSRAWVRYFLSRSPVTEWFGLRMIQGTVRGGGPF